MLGLLAGVFIALSSGASTATAEACHAPDGFANASLLQSMRRGVNLPGWDNPDAAQRPTVAQLEALRGRGFGHIRLPLGNARLTGAQGQAYLDAMVEEVVRLLSLGYTVTLDLHANGTVGRLFSRDRQEGESYLKEMWSSIARRIRFFDPAKVAVELLNEPQIDQDVWIETAGRLIDDIRRVLPHTTIVVGPSGPQRHEMLAGMEPFADGNVVYAVHYYDPFIFTHQGADWGDSDAPLQYLKGLPFPASIHDRTIRDLIAALQRDGHGEAVKDLTQALETEWSEATLAPAFETMAGWSREHARPVVVNEFGTLSYFAPRQARLNWLATVRKLAEANCLGWTHWDFYDGFGLIDLTTGMPDQGVMDALTPDTR